MLQNNLIDKKTNLEILLFHRNDIRLKVEDKLYRRCKNVEFFSAAGLYEFALISF